MDYGQAVQKLKKYDQMQILRYYNELTAQEQKALLDDIDRADFEPIITDPIDATNGLIEPMGAMKLNEIKEQFDNLEEEGLEIIRSGKVACLLLAGGQGTRLGADVPKGAVNVGLTHELYIFECLINNLMDVVKQAGRYITLLIMTSEKNNEATKKFFEEHDFFGYDRDYIHFFVQDMVPSTDLDKKVFLEAKNRIALSPNGNGGWFKSIRNAGYEKLMDLQNIEWLNVFAVDNVLQRMADPAFVAATARSGCEVGAKVISKAYPEEKVGVLCYRDGRPSIVEYSELTEEMMYQKNDDGSLAYNSGVILNYLFKMSALKKIANKDMPLHIATKIIPYIDDNGMYIKPDKPNGHKYETLVLDMISLMNGCFAYEVDRNKEFAPIKNLHGLDSLDSAREMLKNYGVEL